LWTEDAWSEETQKLGQPLGQPPGQPRLTGQERNMRRTSNMRQTVQGSNASHPQPISSKWGGGKGKLARKCGNLAPSLHAPLLKQQELEELLDAMQGPGAHPAFVGPARGQEERAQESDFVVTSAGPDGRSSLDGNDGLGPLERAVQQALELHPSLRPSPVPRIFIKGQHESSRLLSLPQPLVLAAAKVLPPLPSISMLPCASSPSVSACHVLLDPQYALDHASRAASCMRGVGICLLAGA